MVGSRNATPITRPHSLCVHSIQYICLNSSSVIRGFKRANSGDDRYFVNSVSHCSGLKGGRDPVTGLHSVILRPDSVNRVRPPNTTMPKTLTALPTSQYPTILELVSGNEDVVAVTSLAMVAFTGE